MFTHYRSQGLIFKKENREEFDQLFTIYTKDFGRLEILGKAIRKISSKLRSSAEIFYLSDIEFIQGKVYKTLTDSVVINDFKNLRKSLGRLAVAYKISEVFDDLVRGQEPDEKLWQLLIDVFEKLNDPRIEYTKYQILYYFFLWNFLSILGYTPELFQCSLCQKKIIPENIFFSPREGGLICSQCKISIKSAKKIDQNIVKIIRIVLKKDWPTLKRLKLKKEDYGQLSLISNFYLSKILEEME